MSMKEISLLLYPNNISNQKNDYYAQVRYVGTITNKDIADLMIAEGSEYHKESIIDILTRCDRIKMEKLAEGYKINTELFQSHLSVKGHFNAASNGIDPEEHQIKLKFSASKRMRELLAKSKVRILGLANTKPKIGRVIDLTTKSENGLITPEQVLQIEGKRLKIRGDDSSVGVYLLNQKSNERIKCKQVVGNEPQKLLILLPDLQAGEYLLEVYTQFAMNRKLINTTVSTSFHLPLYVK
ncbi:DNA-binding domain-containing protein [Marinifilum flexuosum]|uniref:DNA-binding domain-containing protein n=1 Tax=Marinifilum flexuosum TaxID=1117708 RepID=UPI002494163C|nr:DNA-binding domain-containing protein [Marinifilum flexuosum]